MNVSCNKEINPSGKGKDGVRSAILDTLTSMLESLLKTASFITDSSSEESRSRFLFLENFLIAKILRLGTLQNLRPASGMITNKQKKIVINERQDSATTMNFQIHKNGSYTK